MTVRTLPLRLGAGVSLPGEPTLEIAAEVFLPPPALLPQARWAWVCLPGGGMSRRFFDLRPDETEDSFSLARALAAQGFVVVLIDHLGIGDSTRPEDGYALLPPLLAAANAHATAEILQRLRTGALAADIPALPALRSIGLGHSMGALMTILQQQEFRQHAAIAVLGFGTDGLPEFLPAEVRELAQDPQAVRAVLPTLAKKMFVQPYPRINRVPRSEGGDLYGSSKADPRGVQALKPALAPLLPVPCFMAMLPGNVRPEAATIEVPVFIGVGERDMLGKPHQLPASFTASQDVTLHILPDTGHSHFLFPTRLQLFRRLGQWANCL